MAKKKRRGGQEKAQEILPPSVVHPPGQQPSVARPPGQQPSVAHPPGQQPSVVRPPGQQPSVVRPPGQQPSVVHPPGQQPSVVRPAWQQPSVVRPAWQQPSVVRPAWQQPRVVSPPEQPSSVAQENSPSAVAIGKPPGPSARPADRGQGDSTLPQTTGVEVRQSPSPPSERPLPISSLGFQFQKLSVRSVAPLRRPSFGTLGRKIGLVANYFPIEIPHGNLHHYDVDVSVIRQQEAAAQGPNRRRFRGLNVRVNRMVVNQMLKDYTAVFKGCLPAYDGVKNLFTRKDLELAPVGCTLIVKVIEDGKEDSYEVTIKKADPGVISLEPLHQLFARRTEEIPHDAIMALDVVLRHGPALTLVPVGRSFFMKPRPDEVPPLSGGREVWFGYYQSLRPAQWRPVLNLDKSATAFYSPLKVEIFLAEVLGVDDPNSIRELQRADSHKFNKEIKGLRIQVIHLPYPRKYRVRKVSQEPARRVIFMMEEDGRQVSKTVEQYFQEKHRIRLKFPNLPCLVVGSEKRPVYLPMEVCRLVEGQPCRKKLTATQTSEMIKCTAIPPAQRFKSIKKSLNEMICSSQPYLREFGLKISTEPLKLEGRVLDAPNVLYNDGKFIKPKEGAWDLRGTHFLRGAEIKRWVLLSFSNPRFCNEQALEEFARKLCEAGRGIDLRMAAPLKIQVVRLGTKIEDLFHKVMSQFPQLELLIIVLPEKQPAPYAEIKKVGETQVGLITQCIKDINATRKCTPPLLVNLCQKINAKMGGINSSFRQEEKLLIFRKPVLIIGVDVAHPAPTEHMPSVAAAAGSLDAHPSRYAISVRLQSERREDICDLKEMVKELLKAFYRHTNYKPEKIIFYRDGVSEGQFQICLEAELAQIKQACSEMTEDYRPHITFVVVQKRHHTRFAPQNERDGVGRHKNIPPGTTVDTEVTHPVNFDFFLCSHFGIQGTSKPTHYSILYDDNKFSADEVQKLTYHLCHTYVRCTRSLSVPPPVQYAHLAAFRARQYILSQASDSLSSSDGKSEIDPLLLAKLVNDVKVCPEMNYKMYYV